MPQSIFTYTSPDLPVNIYRGPQVDSSGLLVETDEENWKFFIANVSHLLALKIIY